MSKKIKLSRSEKSALKKARARKRTVIILSVIAAAAVAAIVAIFVLRLANQKYADLSGAEWHTLSAVDATGDEVDLTEAYGIKYSNYRGGLVFSEDKTFRIWLHPGEEDPENQSGTYETDGKTIFVTYGNGNKDEFVINRSEAGIDTITAGYDGYTVTFSQDKPQDW